MPRGKRKTKYPIVLTEFDASMDTPLRYFSPKKTFVRSTLLQNYKLYCDQHMVIMLTRDGFIYKFPAYKPSHEEYVEAFINEYAPHISYDTIKHRLSLCKPVYIGLPEPVTL